jgi:hypothetical protein
VVLASMIGGALIGIRFTNLEMVTLKLNIFKKKICETRWQIVVWCGV